jgi:DNA repair exonuclease SbcCD ATPase subunit
MLSPITTVYGILNSMMRYFIGVLAAGALALSLPVFAQENSPAGATRVVPRPAPLEKLWDDQSGRLGGPIREELWGMKQEVEDARARVREEIRDRREEVRENFKETRQNVREEIRNLRQSADRPLPAPLQEEIQKKRVLLREEIEARRLALQKEITSRREEMQSKIKAARTALQERMSQFRDERKKKIVAELDERLREVNARMIDRITAALDRLDGILADLIARSDAAPSGTDLSAVRAALARARTAIDAARAALAAQAAKVYAVAVTTESQARQDVGAVRNALERDLKTVHEMVIQARDAVHAASQLLRTALGSGASSTEASQ